MCDEVNRLELEKAGKEKDLHVTFQPDLKSDRLTTFEQC